MSALLNAAQAAIAAMETEYARLSKLNASNRVGDALPFAYDNYNAAFEKAGAAAIAYIRQLPATPNAATLLAEVSAWRGFGYAPRELQRRVKAALDGGHARLEVAP